MATSPKTPQTQTAKTGDESTTDTQPSGKAYKALTPIEFDNDPYGIGATLYLSDKTAAPLLAVNAIELAGKDAEAA